MMQQEIDLETLDYDLIKCLLCNDDFILGEEGNELGFCINCQDKKDFPYDLDKYYKDYDNGKVAFKGIETMERGILESYKR